MKKVGIIIAVICVMLFMPKVYAGTAYVDSINIDAKINIDGSMTVKETIRWDVQENINGLYRDILITNNDNQLNNALDMTIHEVNVNGMQFEQSYVDPLNGTNGQYYINLIPNGKQIKIYTPSCDEYKTTVITYTLHDVVVKYNDVAEIYWNFIGSGWEYGIQDVSINITLPGDSKTLKVFGHGPLYGYSEILDTKSVSLNVSHLRSGEMLDARVLFDAGLVSSTKIVRDNVLEKIVMEETKLAEEANIRREEAKRALTYSIIILAVALIIPVFVYISARKKAFKATFKGKYYRELPEDCGPAVMNRLLHPITGNASSYDMLATLLDLVRRKYVEIQPIVKENKKKPTDYLLKLVKTDLGELNEQESHFVNELIFVDTKEITLNELSKKNSKSVSAHSKAQQAYEKWTKLITSVAKEKDLLKKEKVKLHKYILKCIPGLIALIAITIYGVIINFEDIMAIGIFGAFALVYELLMIGMAIHNLEIRTKKGVEHKAMWKAFRKFLQDFSKMDEHEYKSIAIWEHYLVYATALGISKKVIKELKIIFPTEFANETELFNTHVTLGLLSDTNTFSSFSSSFTSATSVAFSAPSSSGSGGGFSGGAGGGRRWRRWR